MIGVEDCGIFVGWEPKKGERGDSVFLLSQGFWRIERKMG